MLMNGSNRNMNGCRLSICYNSICVRKNRTYTQRIKRKEATQGHEGPCAVSIYDSNISIFLDGRVKLTRNNGGWNGVKEEDISPLLVIDYLRSRGYEFKYEIPKKLDRRIKLSGFL